MWPVKIPRAGRLMSMRWPPREWRVSPANSTAGRAVIPLERVEPPVDHGTVTAEPACRGDLTGVVELHKLSFPHFFMTSLGGPFLEAYYTAVLEYPRQLFYVARRGRDVAGFVAGFVAPPG